MIRLLYNIFIAVAHGAVRLYAPFNEKVRRALRGREGMFERLEARKRKPGGRTIWFHASSMGEFEQARPLIEQLKGRMPATEIVVSFFSPSGFDNYQSYKYADVITYIPFDSPSNAGRFVEALGPSAAVVMRYDVWPNHLRALHRAKVKTILVNATMNPRSPRFFMKSFHRRLYGMFDRILAVSEGDRSQFLRFGIEPSRIQAAGDTRYDQVIARCSESSSHRLFPDSFFEGKIVLVAGSTWRKDEEFLISALGNLSGRHPELVSVIVPHEPSEKNLTELEQTASGALKSIRFSRLADYNRENLIIVDGIGMLVTLYKYAGIVYVGGGFGAGIHNVLEPAVYGTPILIGPNYSNSNEARALLERGGIIACDGGEAVAGGLERLLADAHLRRTMGDVAKNFVSEKTGATETIVSYLVKAGYAE